MTQLAQPAAGTNHAMSIITPAIIMSSAESPPPVVDLQRIQRLRKLVLWGMFGLALPPALFVGSYWWPNAKTLHKAIEWAGIVLIFISIFGRTWCTLYIGGRKKRELVTLGPYSVCRNPLYAFTMLGAFGIGAQSGSIILASAVAVAIFAVFRSVVMREEAFLAGAFDVEFARYADQVPRFLPHFSRWKDAKDLTVSPPLVVRTFLDATLFLLAIPAAEILEELQNHGTIPVLLRLP